jgi:hypothetical protein
LGQENEIWGKIGFGAKKKLILGQKRIKFGVVKNKKLCFGTVKIIFVIFFDRKLFLF